jgi:nucleoside-diphosphate-sugar epimerase
MKTILIAGGTGLVGQLLAHTLKEEGYNIRLISRSKPTNPVFWSPWEKPIQNWPFVFFSTGCLKHAQPLLLRMFRIRKPESCPIVPLN